MAKVHGILKMKDFKLNTYINLMMVASLVSAKLYYKMYDWLFDNIDKFYTIKMQEVVYMQSEEKHMYLMFLQELIK